MARHARTKEIEEVELGHEFLVEINSPIVSYVTGFGFHVVIILITGALGLLALGGAGMWRV